MRNLEREYEDLANRYDTLENVLQNVIDRDKNVFRILFESDLYDFDSESDEARWNEYERLLDKSQRELSRELVARTDKLSKDFEQALASYERMESKFIETGSAADYIPSIQPVINPGLTLLTASYGMRMHPFYRTLYSHQGVDFTLPEGSSVFATADGKVKDIITRRSSSGRSVIIDHGNGYETHYNHLSSTGNLRKYQTVRRGDIIAYSGNTGLSLAPHLHYEIWHNGMRVNPIHYFFMELSPSEYQRMLRIAESGMQSFD